MTDTLEPSESDPLDEIAFAPSDAEIDGLPDASRIYIGALEAGVAWRDARLKAIDARPVVKALEWTKRDGRERWDCDHPLGEAWIKKYLGREDYTLYAPGSYGSGNDFQTLEAAKQVCQDHFAKLVTQCLEPAACVVSEEQVRADERERLAKLAGKDDVYSHGKYGDMGLEWEYNVADWLRAQGDKP